VLNFLESFARLAAHAPGRRVRRDNLRMQFFEVLQAPHQLVVFGVADLGTVQNVVLVFVVTNRGAQLFSLTANV